MACSSASTDDADVTTGAIGSRPTHVDLLLSGAKVSVLRTRAIGDARPIAPVAPPRPAMLRWRFTPRDGSAVITGAIDDPRTLRSEFAADGRPDDRTVKGAVGSFAVELPSNRGVIAIQEADGSPIGTVQIGGSSGGEDEIVNLGEDVIGEPLSLVDHPLDDKHVHLLFVAEGYRQEELATFHADASAVAKSLAATAGYAEHWSEIDVFAQDVKSAESGVSDPEHAIKKNTAFDVAFGNDDQGSPRRCLMVAGDVLAQNYASMRVIASKVKADVVVLLANTAEYGGCASPTQHFVTASKHSAAVRIVAHELGHALFHLADEYAGGGVGCQPAIWSTGSANVSSNLAALPWSDMFTTPTIPTLPGAADVVGAYEGAGYCDKGVYRAHENCLMRDLGAEFCPVCRRALDGVFASLANGGDPIDRQNQAPPKVTVTNSTGAGIFVACIGNAGPACSGATWIEPSQAQTIDILGGALIVDTTTVPGAPVTWSWRQVAAPSANITIFANADDPLRHPDP